MLFAAVCSVAVVAGFLQEGLPDDLAKAAADAGVTLPLPEPRITVELLRGTLEVWSGDTMVKRYDVGWGRAHAAGAFGAGKCGTPVGEYHVVRKSVRKDVGAHGSRFIELDFPNADDLDIAWDRGLISRADAIPPASPAVRAALGGPLGIQGNFFFFSSRHCTDGSIAVTNASINEIHRHIPVGTPVTITE